MVSAATLFSQPEYSARLPARNLFVVARKVWCAGFARHKTRAQQNAPPDRLQPFCCARVLAAAGELRVGRARKLLFRFWFGFWSTPGFGKRLPLQLCFSSRSTRLGYQRANCLWSRAKFGALGSSGTKRAPNKTLHLTACSLSAAPEYSRRQVSFALCRCARFGCVALQSVKL